ncbi:hypothetical protein F5X68DRAFT_228299 [Plectosphaerella plurivora]|uniref:Carboxymuconolactone decarboxylase-like domain-containing protein n=1 Tax=Plectosphaerella plurivora TaxID=936078 RepID=A0A9P9ABX4_9PEZI|nr:hypothetical protein F5X68DRAFT_228299 [Plectosphaerella plurivora]
MTRNAPKSDVLAMFQEIEQTFTATKVLSQKWDLIVLSSLAGGNDPALCADLYLYLIAKPDFSTPEQRIQLIRRIRETLFKLVCIVGVIKPIEAIRSINAVEREEDKDHSTTREGWQCDAANLKAGNDWLGKIYTRNTDETIGYFNDHKDFAWLSRNITYGLFLSDRQVMDDAETETVVLAGILMQNLHSESMWHIRGARRIGLSKEDVQVVWNSVMRVSRHLGITLDRIPTVDEVECEV